MDYSNIGLNEYLQPISAPISSNSIVSAYEFDSLYERGVVNNSSILINAIDNAKIRNSYRAYNAVVSTVVGDGDYTDIQTAIDSLNDAGEGGIILVRPGTYYPEAPIVLYDNITLIGVDPTNSIVDCQDMGDASAGCVQIKGTLVSSSGSISVTNGDATVTGSGSQFSTDSVAAGDYIYINGVRYIVLSVTNDTSLELTENYSGASDSALSYRIARPVINTNIKNLTIKDGSDASTPGVGIYIDDADNLTVENTFIFNCADGMQIDWVYNGKFTDCECSDNSAYGIDLTFAISSYFTGVVCFNNTTSGMRVASASTNSNNIIDGVVCNANGSYGIHLFVSSYIVMDNVICIGNGVHGVYFEGSTYNKLMASITRQNGTDGIHLTNRISVNSEYNIILGCNASDNGDDGVELTSGANLNNVSHCVLQNNGGTGLVDNGTSNETWDNV